MSMPRGPPGGVATSSSSPITTSSISSPSTTTTTTTATSSTPSIVVSHAIASSSSHGSGAPPVSVVSTGTGSTSSADVAVMAALVKNLQLMQDRISAMGTGSSPGGASGSSFAKVQVQAPKNFSVGQNFRIWLERFQSYANLVNLSVDQLRPQLLSRLDHQAYTAVANLHLAETLPYEDFCAAISRRFNNTSREDFKMQLRSRVQKSQEAAEAFADLLQELALNAYPDSGHQLQEEMALDQFQVGVALDENLRQQLYISAPKTLEEALRTVRQLKAAKLVCQRTPMADASRARGKVAPVTNYSETKSEPSEMTKILELLTKMDARVTQLESRGSSSPCWRCQGQGHRPSQCPTLECYNCHKMGHMSRECRQPRSGNSRQGASKGRPAPQ